MSDVRWASLGLVVALSASSAMLGCGDSTTSCTTGTEPDGSTTMIPRVDAAGVPGRDAGAGGAGTLGAACTASTECRSGLTCLKPTDDLRPGEGPPNGVCTADCSADPATGCRAFGGACVQFNDVPETFYCVEPCQLGGTPAGKCHSRIDFACESLFDNSNPPRVVLTACLPLCTDDADCGGTRKCDLSSGLCTARPSTGLLPTGSGCLSAAECVGGLCVDGSPSDTIASFGVCTGYCRFGGLEGCGYRRNVPVNEAGAACGLGISTEIEGDEGYCVELCDSNADCALTSPGWGCANTAAYVRKWGHGLCTPGGGPVPDAGTDAGRPADAGRDAAAEASRESGAPEAAVTAEAAVPPAGDDGGADAGTD